MALSARELVLVIRAKDELTRTLNNIGTSLRTLDSSTKTTEEKLSAIGAGLLTAGTTLAAAGTLGVGYFNSATNAAADYSKAAALTFTQAQQAGVSMQDLKDMGLDVATRIPVELGDVQGTLFDIFSTIDVNGTQAKFVLEQLSTASVAGNADLQDVSRTTLAALNAWQLPAEDVTRLLDAQFKMVEKGVGTYGEFSSSLGLAVPAAVAAGQNFHSLTADMAFLTRNAVPIPNAVASVSRAFELLASPKVQRNLEAYGITIKDNNGEFLQFNEIITQLAENKGWAKMTEPERKKAFTEIFGQGTIQARRFFDVAIPNYQQLNDLHSEFENSSGAMERAYEIMYGEPAVKAQLLTNQLEAMKVVIGNELLPAKVKLMEAVMNLIDWWNSLSESTRSLIVKFAAIASIAMVVVGTIMAVVGGFLLFVGIVAPVVGGVGALAAIFGWVLVGIIAFAAAAYLIYKNWDTVGPFLAGVWAYISDAAVNAWNVLKDVWAWFQAEALPIIIDWANATWTAIQYLWDKFVEFATWFKNDAWPAIVDGAQWAWDKLTAFWDWLTNTAIPAASDFATSVVDFFQSIWDKGVEVYGWFNDEFGPGFQRVWDSLKENIPPIIDEIKETWQSLKDKWDEIWPPLEEGFQSFMDFHDQIMEKVREVWDFIQPYVQTAITQIATAIGTGLAIVLQIWSAGWAFVKDFVVDVWNFITRTIDNYLTIVSNLIQLALNVLQGDWREAWNNIWNILKAIWDQILATIRLGWELIKGVFNLGIRTLTAIFGEFVRWLLQKAVEMNQGFVNKITEMKNSAIAKFNELRTGIINIFSNAVSWLRNAGANIVQGLVNGINSKIQTVRSALSTLTGLIPSWKGPPSVDRKLLFESGSMIMEGLETGLRSGWGGVQSYLTGITTTRNFTPSVTLSTGGAGAQPNNTEEMNALLRELVEIMRDPRNRGLHADVINVADQEDIAKLDYWSRTQFAGS